MRTTDNSPVLKVKTNLKAGECCWEAFKKAQELAPTVPYTYTLLAG